MTTIKVIVIFLVVTTTASFSNGSRVKFYFPDPKAEEQFVPAYIDGEGLVKPDADNATLKTHFFLLTKYNLDQDEELFIGDLETLESSHFIKGAPLKVFCHGYAGDKNGYDFPQRISREYLSMDGDMNAILVDWSSLAVAPWYTIAAGAANSVGQRVGEFVQFLVDEGWASLDNVHIFGFSLGSHVAGAAGAQLNGLAARVTAIDPALPLFGNVGDDERIDPTDGKFVDVIHTSGGYLWENGLAFIEPRGDADFYPNSGRHQPGCEGPEDNFGGCSHHRAPMLFIESIKSSTGFYGCLCESYELYVAGGCDCTDLVLMGDKTPSTANGSYWLSTAAQSPFALGPNGAIPTP